ncbi:hypothetical protein ACFQGE_10150 [Halomicroarcula sp. GCM10025817]|uniref:hypothetical protein n=1 Tax=Haloarcula regularis TaxID=3033392 RepID=UPI0023E8C77D|nr:hypothetical protein [Halomicroarcula sp. SYNS111]
MPEHVALASGAGFLLVAVATSARIPVAVVGGLLVAAALFVGPSAALGGTSGLVIHDLFRGAVGVGTLTLAVWLCVFVGLLAWFSPALAGGRARLSVRSPPRALRSYVVGTVVAGLYATAASAWVATVAGHERFYTAAADLLPGVLVAGLVGVAAIVTARRLGRAVSVPRATVGTRPGRLTTLALFVVGAAWLVGAIGTDLLAHDLGLFPTDIQLAYYVAGLLGTGSLVATVGSAVLLSVYRYGELAVVLSAPLAGVLSWVLVSLGRTRVQSPTPDIDFVNGGTDND